MNFGAKIKRRRKELNLTLKEISTRVGVAEATVQRWESGNIKMIKGDKLNLLAAALQINVEELTYWLNNQEPTAEDYERWEQEFNPSGKLAKESKACELFESCYGKQACAAVTKYLKLDDVDRGKIEERMDTMLEDKKYSAKDGSSSEKAI